MTELLTEIARNLIAAFLLSLGILPSEDEDTFEIRDHGPHRVYTQLAHVPDALADNIDEIETLDKLVCFVEQYNTLPIAAKFQPHNAEVYICPCCGDTFLYVGIYHTATT